MESRLVKSTENKCNVDILSVLMDFHFIIYSDEVNVVFCPKISLDPEKLFYNL